MYYDSLLGKLIVHGPDRAAAIARSLRAGMELAVSGTVSDLSPGEIRYVHLTIKDHGTAALPFYQWWNGIGWLGTLTSTRASVTGTQWTYANLPTWTDEHFYTVSVEAEDKAGNRQNQDNFVQNKSSMSFYVDRSTPIVSFSTPPYDNYYTNDMDVVTGRIVDPHPGVNAGVTLAGNVKVQIKYIVGNTTYYYDNSDFWPLGPDCPVVCNETDSWFNPAVFSPSGPSSGTWVFNNSLLQAKWVPDQTYVISARGIDDASPAGNEGTATPLRFYRVVYDKTSPVALATIPADKTPAQKV